MSTPLDALPSATADKKGLQWLYAALAFAASVLLIAVAARGDLFIDEVVSIRQAQVVHHWWEIFSECQNDNNHLLNTLFMRVIGDQWHLYLYRIPAVVFGIAMMAVLLKTSQRLGKGLPLWVACLAGLSYPVILYCSEARGYAPAMFFAVAAFELLQRCWEKCTPLRLFLFWVALGLGALSHFSFVMVCIALGIWSLAHDWLARAPVRLILLNALKYYGPPALLLVCVYLFFIRHMVILGGLIQSYWVAISDTALYLLGFAVEDKLRILAALVTLALILFGIWKLYRQKREEWIFFALILLVAPAMTLILWRPTLLYFRYFCVCFPFFYLLLAYCFAGWFRDGGKSKLIAVLLVLFLTMGHFVKTAGLVHLGRGHYRQALLDIAAGNPGPVIRIGSNQDFKNETLLDFYSRFLPPSKQLEYSRIEHHNEDKPEWYVLFCDDASFVPFPDLQVGTVGKYDLFGSYYYCGSSGWSWFVYRRSLETAHPNK